MSKYIIEIEDVPFSKVRIDADSAQNINLYRAKGFSALVFDEHGLDKLTPFDKALNNELEETYQKGFEAGQHEATTLEYQQGLEEGKKQARAQAHLDVCHDIERVAHGNYQHGLDDAWECARRIALTKTDKDCPYFTVTELKKIFGYSNYQSVFDTYSASEAIEKIQAYEQQKAGAEIKVGDEVTLKSNDSNCLGVVVRVDDTNAILMTRDGYTTMYRLEILKKTNKHFPQMAELLKAMKGEQRSCSTCKHSSDPDGIRCRDCCGQDKWEPKEGAE